MGKITSIFNRRLPLDLCHQSSLTEKSAGGSDDDLTHWEAGSGELIKRISKSLITHRSLLWTHEKLKSSNDLHLHYEIGTCWVHLEKPSIRTGTTTVCT